MSLSLDGENRRRVADNVRFITGSGAPTNAVTGAGVAGPGALYFDITNAIIYVNTNTLASPTWTVLGISNIADGSITTIMLADLGITTAKLDALAVTAGKLATDSVETAKIKALNVTTAKIALLNITTALLADLGVTTGKLADLAVTAAKIADSTITAAKMLPGVIAQISGTISSVDITGIGAGQLGHANGYPIVAAPGAANIVELISLIAFYDFSVAAYTGGGNVTVNRAAGAGALTGLISAANSFGAAVDKIVHFLPLATAGINLTLDEGINLVVAAPFTQPGTAAGVIRYVCNYRIHATGL